MRVLAIVIALGLGASAYAADAPTIQRNAGGTATKVAAAPVAKPFNVSEAVDFSAVNGAVWARAADGRTFKWQSGSWIAGIMPQAITAYKPVTGQPSPTSNPARRYSRDPSAVVSYPEGPSENVGANDPPMAGGRGRFSD